MTFDQDLIARAVAAVAGAKARADNLLAVNVELFVRLPESDVNSRLRLAHFLAQAGHECGGFSSFSENLNYSAKRLLEMNHEGWPGRFPSRAVAERYGGHPEALANYVYAGRLGNGEEGSGDGWRYRGRGIFQLTGRDNYRDAGKVLGLDLQGNPDMAAEPGCAVRIALYYWTARKMSPLADRDDVAAVTKKLNGGVVGLDDRKARLLSVRRVLGV